MLIIARPLGNSATHFVSTSAHQNGAAQTTPATNSLGATCLTIQIDRGAASTRGGVSFAKQAPTPAKSSSPVRDDTGYTRRGSAYNVKKQE